MFTQLLGGKKHFRYGNRIHFLKRQKQLNNVFDLMPNLKECANNLEFAIAVLQSLSRFSSHLNFQNDTICKRDWGYIAVSISMLGWNRHVRSQNSTKTLPSACIFSSLCCVTEAFLNVGDPGEIKSIVKSHAHVVKYQGFDLASHQPKRDSTVNHLSCLPHLWMACLQTESNKSCVLCCQSGV